MDKKIIVLDFDGVLVLDSDAVFKKEAWDIVFNPWIGRYETLLEEGNRLCVGQAGGRTKVLHYVLERLNEPVETIPELAEKLSREFDNHVQKKILEAGLETDALKLLETLSSRGVKIYLNSGTATPALQRTTRNLEIGHFFSGILGSTKEPLGGSKTDNLKYVAKHEQVEPSAILFVGDGELDYKAAVEFGCPFVGIANKWNRWNEKEKPFPVVTRLRDILKFVIYDLRNLRQS